MKHVTIYTDGACSGNPGPGGYGVVLLFGEHVKELSQGYRDTTNNRMEMRAVIAGLLALKERCRVTLYSDSKYIVDGVNRGWARRWEANNWMRNRKDRALNADLWEEILALLRNHHVEFRWTRGHAGDKWNERCDKLAVAASSNGALLDDV